MYRSFSELSQRNNTYDFVSNPAYDIILSCVLQTKIEEILICENDCRNLEANLFTGPLPSSLGNLTRLGRLLLSANNFTGPIPESFGNLKNLTDFRIDGNFLSGKIPDFIGNWTRLVRL
ncbi:unnamed protein product [Thlaspi arvense]|uniref:Uncharacterized protein n=1 Tax=Thlaspi arvense TaxID=13288 RepID=A0AAU9RD63_THLAR|nr:unnamed protein product [Thlaspi arvense]